MFDIGWSELLLIGIVALIVIGPKDLPDMFRTLGRFTAKARSMAREFSRAMEDAAKTAGVDDVAADLRKATSKRALGLDALEKAADKFEKWEPKLPSAQTKGPATQALADQQAAEAAARKAGVGIGTEAASPAAKLAEATPAATPPVTRAATTRSRATRAADAPTAAKPASKPKADPKPKADAKPKAAPKPRKSAAKSEK